MKFHVLQSESYKRRKSKIRHRQNRTKAYSPGLRQFFPRMAYHRLCRDRRDCICRSHSSPARRALWSRTLTHAYACSHSIVAMKNWLPSSSNRDIHILGDTLIFYCKRGGCFEQCMRLAKWHYMTITKE